MTRIARFKFFPADQPSDEPATSLLSTQRFNVGIVPSGARIQDEWGFEIRDSTGAIVYTFRGPICSSAGSRVAEVGTTMDALLPGSYVIEPMINGAVAHAPVRFTVTADPNAPAQYQGVGFVDVDLAAGIDEAAVTDLAREVGASRTQRAKGNANQDVLRLWIEPVRPTRAEANAEVDRLMELLTERLEQSGIPRDRIAGLRTDAIPAP